MRKAIFAALRDHYGTDLPRAARLEQLTMLTGRPIWSTNQLTRGEAGRILATLRTTTPGPAGRQLHAGRAYIRQAARDGSITPAARDRYLTILDTESRRAPSPAAALTAIRDRAIELYENREICHPGLTGFLTATSLTPHPQH